MPLSRAFHFLTRLLHSLSQVWLENLSKTNPGGTQLNDAPVEARTLLEHDDIISICGRRFRFEYDGAAVVPEGWGGEHCKCPSVMVVVSLAPPTFTGAHDMMDATVQISAIVPEAVSLKKIASAMKATLKADTPKQKVPCLEPLTPVHLSLSVIVLLMCDRANALAGE